MKDITQRELAALPRGEAEAAIRSRCTAVYLGREQVLCRILGKPKIYLSTRDVGFAGHVMLDGFWEAWLTLFFMRFVKPGMTVIDVGANFGYYTLLFGDAVGARGRVMAVEPIPATVDLLRRSVSLNGFDAHTQVVCSALGAQASGSVSMFVPEGEPKNATVVNASYPGAVAIPVTSLDALAGSLDRVDLIKIDAEGAEVDILAGAQNVIQKHRPALLLEFNAARYARPGEFLQTILTSYGRVSTISIDGTAVPVAVRKILETQIGEDWLLLFQP